VYSKGVYECTIRAVYECVYVSCNGVIGCVNDSLSVSHSGLFLATSVSHQRAAPGQHTHTHTHTQTKFSATDIHRGDIHKIF